MRCVVHELHDVVAQILAHLRSEQVKVEGRAGAAISQNSVNRILQQQYRQSQRQRQRHNHGTPLPKGFVESKQQFPSPNRYELRKFAASVADVLYLVEYDVVFSLCISLPLSIFVCLIVFV